MKGCRKMLEEEGKRIYVIVNGNEMRKKGTL